MSQIGCILCHREYMAYFFYFPYQVLITIECTAAIWRPLISDRQIFINQSISYGAGEGIEVHLLVTFNVIEGTYL